MMKILLLGKNGQVGWELQRSLAPLGEIVALDRSSEGEYCGDLSNLEALAKSVRLLEPDVIVNAAAYTAVDKAEADTELATIVNKDAPTLLAKLAEELGTLLIHYSTDYVFDGTGDSPWQEQDKTGPLSVYGRTKLAGEVGIMQSGCNYLIFRTSWVFAAKGNNFAKTMLRLASDRDELDVIGDQIGAPTSAELIADVTAHTIKQVLKVPALKGVYHLTASGETSWYEYANYVFSEARAQGMKLQVSSVKKIRTSEYSMAATRPLNSRLNCSKLGEAFSLNLPNWKVGVKRMLIEAQG